MGGILADIAVVEYELILIASVLFLVFGLDDLIVDIVWIGRAALRKAFPEPTPLNGAQTQRNFAIIIPAWQEAAVIAGTVQRCLEAYKGQNFHIIVGCYPNDFATPDAVRLIGSADVSIALNEADGPTTKGDCLNAAWRQARVIEKSTGTVFDAVVLHDAEDWASDEELSTFASLLDRYALLQLPVIPLPVRGSPWISGHYCDEFAEAHRRSMIVRQAVGASIPSAGVGCCIRRDLIERLALVRNGDPFDPDCLTEDYELGLFTKSVGLPSAFVRRPSSRAPGIVATQACFPDEIDAAVRQKARWITGIALSGWDRTGWGRGVAENWMRLRDRKTVVEAIALMCAYVGIALFVCRSIAASASGVDAPVVSSNIETLLLINLVVMAWRLLIRGYCTARVYGWRSGLIAIPRALTGNLIAILAAREAVALYCRMHFSGKTIWEKTRHDRPIDPATLVNG